jgi:hypothetical protein
MANPGDVQIGRLSRFFTKWLGTKGPSPRVAMGGEIVPVLPLWSGIENRYLESWNTFGFVIALAASAGNQNAFMLRNPVGSHVVAVIYKLKLSTTTAAAMTYITSFGASAASLGTSQPMANSRFDPRGSPSPAMLFSTTQAAAPADLANIIDRTQLGIAAGVLPNFDVIVTDSQEIPLLPGDAIQSRTGNANVESEFAIFWRERVLEDSELA